MLPFPDSTIDGAVFTDTAAGTLAYDLALQDQRLLLRPSSGHGRPVEITFTAGYGGTAAAVPAAIRQAMLLLIGQWYDNREAVTVGAAGSPMPMAVDALLAPYRRIQL